MGAATTSRERQRLHPYGRIHCRAGRPARGSLADVRFYRRPDRGAVRRADAADLGSGLDPPAAAAVGLRQSPGADAHHRHRPHQRGPRPVLRDRLADHSEPGDGPDRSAARPVHQHLPRRPDFHGRDIRDDHVRHAGAQPGAGRPLVGAAVRRAAAALQLRLPRRPDELHVRGRARAVGDGGLDLAARAAMAAPPFGVVGVRGRAVLLPSVVARHLRHRPDGIRAAAAVVPRRQDGDAARCRRLRPGIRAARTVALRQPDPRSCQQHLVGAARQDQRDRLHHRALFGPCRVRDHRRRRRRGGVRGAPPAAADSSVRRDAARRRHAGLHGHAAGDVRDLHGRPAHSDRARLHADRLRRSQAAPSPGAPRLRRRSCSS